MINENIVILSKGCIKIWGSEQPVVSINTAKAFIRPSLFYKGVMKINAGLIVEGWIK